MSKRSLNAPSYAESDGSNGEFASGDVDVQPPQQQKRRKVVSGASPDAAKNPVVVTPKKQRVNKRKKTDETTFNFLKLPGEIRNAIYEYAFTSDQDMCICSPRDPATGRMALDGEPYRHRTKAVLRTKKKKNDVPYRLLLTCKQVCREATPILYTSNTFHFWAQEALHAFMARFPRAVPHLRTIRVPLRIDTRGCRAFDCKTVLDNLARVPLEALETYIDASARTVEEAARDFYDVAREWIDAVGQRYHDDFAALDILKIECVILLPNRGIYPDRTEAFYGALKALIDKHRG